MNSNPTSNTYPSAHSCAENSKNCWPQGTRREGIDENDVRNYSKLNKKGLLKKVKQLIKAQNGGNSKKKYRLRGGTGAKTLVPPPPLNAPGYHFKLKLDEVLSILSSVKFNGTSGVF